MAHVAPGDTVERREWARSRSFPGQLVIVKKEEAPEICSEGVAGCERHNLDGQA